MDVSSKPLRTWERVYWRLFVVFGTVGLAYETYVLGNCRVLRGGDVADLRTTRTMGGGAVGDALYRSNNALRSHHLMSDEEVDKAHAVVVRAHEWKPEAAVES